MKRYTSVITFYLAAFLVVWGLSRMDKPAPDGGWGFSAYALILIGCIIALLAIVNFYKGFKRERYFLIIGLLHLIILLAGIYFLVW